MSMEPYLRKIKKLQDTPFGYTLSLVSGKWKMVILYILSEEDSIRYNELQRLIGGITYKTLSAQLKELEEDNLIVRKEYPQIPPKVEYSLSKRGKSLMPILNEMCEWGIKELNFELSDCHKQL